MKRYICKEQSHEPGSTPSTTGHIDDEVAARPTKADVAFGRSCENVQDQMESIALLSTLLYACETRMNIIPIV